MIKINEMEHTQSIVEISELCSKARFKVSMNVDRESCRNKIVALRERRFSGVVKLSSGIKEILSTEIIVFRSGEIKLCFVEENGKNEEITPLNYGSEEGERLLEIYESSDEQMKNFYKITGEAENSPKNSDIKPYSVKEIERTIEAYLVIKKYGTKEPLEEIEQR